MLSANFDGATNSGPCRQLFFRLTANMPSQELARLPIPSQPDAFFIGKLPLGLYLLAAFCACFPWGFGRGYGGRAGSSLQTLALSQRTGKAEAHGPKKDFSKFPGIIFDGKCGQMNPSKTNQEKIPPTKGSWSSMLTRSVSAWCFLSLLSGEPTTSTAVPPHTGTSP